MIRAQSRLVSLWPVVVIGLLAGCEAGFGSFLEDKRPKDAPEGTCWHKMITPARFETVTEQVAQTGRDGTIVYKTLAKQQLVQQRQERWVETPCPEDLTPSFWSSLQRALRARQLYKGPITGSETEQTTAAILQFQKREGIIADVFSRAAAVHLGLLPTRFAPATSAEGDGTELRQR